MPKSLFMGQRLAWRCARITAEDFFIPLAQSSKLMLPDSARIVQKAFELTGKQHTGE